MSAVFRCVVLLGLAAQAAMAADAARPQGAAVNYRLPADGPLPRTYRVTLAITAPDNPDWIVSTFISGEPRTVTEANGGVFTDYWDGLDDNFMPVPPGTYGVKGIFTPARKWEIDGKYHTLIPRLVGGIGAWTPTRGEGRKTQWLKGHGFGAFTDINATRDGKAVIYHNYLENARNALLFDLTRPIGYEQGIASYPSGGAAGGTAAATDGEVVWCYSTNGNPHFIHRGDGRPFGSGRGQYRRNVFVPGGPVDSMDAAKIDGRRFLYVAVGGDKPHILVLDGDNAEQLASIPIEGALRAIAVTGERLWVLRQVDGRKQFVVESTALDGGIPQGDWAQDLLLKDIDATDLEVDSHQRLYVTNVAANAVLRYDDGKLAATIGRAGAVQAPGTYDPQIFMRPAKLATWTDAAGRDRLLVLEYEGPNRLSEWTPDGKLLRQWIPPQIEAVRGAVAMDSEDPEHIYVITNSTSGLVRYRIEYDGGQWMPDAVWPDICRIGDGWPGGYSRAEIINCAGRKYLVFANRVGSTYGVIAYRMDGIRWVPSAALVPADGTLWWWHDANSNGQIEEAEYRNAPAKLPTGIRYWGEKWLDDMSLVVMEQHGPDARHVWRIAPRGFDEHGNPIFNGDDWHQLLTDPIFKAKMKGTATALYGANEVATSFSSDWSQIDGSMERGFYVHGRGGPSFNANMGAQAKLSHYVPDGNGGYALKWRVGRIAAMGLPGELLGAMLVYAPVNGLLGVQDASWATYHVFTDDGLYVESIFPAGGPDLGIYDQPGEHFQNGYHYLNKRDGKVYISIGKSTPLLFEVEGWTADSNPVRRLTTVDRRITITAPQIADPPEVALRVRGGAGKAPLARFYPATGGVSLDGSLDGWQNCEPVVFGAREDKHVEVRCLYDPDHLYLRWHARLDDEFVPRELQPAERIFTHDREADVLSFYLQGDPAAKPNGPAAGRPGDVRLIFSLMRDGGELRPVVLGLYPKWFGKKAGNPQTYGSPTGEATFQHVGLVESARLGARVDDDKRGFVIAAAIPRTSLPSTLPAFDGRLRTTVNFSATYNGHTKFWWANADGSAGVLTHDEPSEARLYPGSWARAQFVGITDGVVVRHWQVCGPWGGQGLNMPAVLNSNGGFEYGRSSSKQALRDFFERASYPPGDGTVDLKAVYRGPKTMTFVDPRRGKLGEHTVRWQKRSVTGRDQSIRLGWAGACYFAATWLFVPEACEIEAELVTNKMNMVRLWVNDERIDIGVGSHGQRHSVRLTLHEGWNRVLYRGYCVGYDLRVGLVLLGPEQRLWNVKLSSVPPKQ